MPSRSTAPLRNGGPSNNASNAANSWSAESLVLRLRTTFSSPEYQPPVLPTVAMELASMYRRDDIQVGDVLKLLERDSLIAGGVLRLAQSAMYQRGGPVRTLTDAVTRLGLRTLSDLCWNVALTARVFRAAGYGESVDALRKHSAATAQIARMLAAFVPFADDYLYTCGLMHDVGAAACLSIAGEVPRGTALPPLDLVWSAVQDVHEDASDVLARAWKLPEDVRVVVARHHHPEIDGAVHPVIAAIGLAEALATESGAPGGQEKLSSGVTEAATQVGIAPAQLDILKRAAEQVVAAIE